MDVKLIEEGIFMDGKYVGFRVKKVTYLTRCPKCDKENYGAAVATGRCAWCGFDANEEKENRSDKA